MIEYPFIMWLLSCVSLTIILTRSVWFKKPREAVFMYYEQVLADMKVDPTFKNKLIYYAVWTARELWDCSQCCGFWTGMLLCIWIYKELSFDIIIFGLIGSIVSFTYTELMDYVKRQ